ncbi:MAG: hypothetical protein LBF16_01280 [Pseudomonadales bacterium]|nr:hypothetical protein [Pseudomonadales bacterium]
MQHTINACKFRLHYESASSKLHVSWPHGTALTSFSVRFLELPRFMLSGLPCNANDIYSAPDADAGLLPRIASAVSLRLMGLWDRHRTPPAVTVQWPHQVQARSAAAWGHLQFRRHNMTRSERLELGKQVREYLASSNYRDRMGRAQDIASDLNGWAAYSSVLERLPTFTSDSRLIYAQCEHFCIADDLQHGSGHTNCCYECWDNGDYVRTEDTDELLPRDDAHADSDGQYYAHLPDDDDDDSGGDGDDSEQDSDGIYQWNTDARHVLAMREIESSASGDFTLGVEFECVAESRGARGDLADHVNNDLSDKVMCKEDGSLPDNGIELVFAPMVLESVRATFDRIKFPSGTEAWSAGCCGLHAHIDARAFTQLTLAKFIAFWNAPGNAGFIRSVAGRHPLHDEQARHYANTVELNTPVEIIKDIKSGALTHSRYRAVNLTTLGPATAKHLGVTYTGGHHSQYNTVELRLFRASMKHERTMAQIDMAHATVEFARQGSVSGMDAKHFIEWLRRHGQRYPHLRTWLGIARAHRPNKPQRVTEIETA